MSDVFDVYLFDPLDTSDITSDILSVRCVRCDVDVMSDVSDVSDVYGIDPSDTSDKMPKCRASYMT